MLASEKGHFKSVEALLKHGANKNTEDMIGRTAATIAIDAGHQDIADLINHGPTDKKKGSSGYGYGATKPHHKDEKDGKDDAHTKTTSTTAKRNSEPAKNEGGPLLLEEDDNENQKHNSSFKGEPYKLNQPPSSMISESTNSQGSLTENGMSSSASSAKTVSSSPDTKPTSRKASSSSSSSKKNSKFELNSDYNVNGNSSDDNKSASTLTKSPVSSQRRRHSMKNIKSAETPTYKNTSNRGRGGRGGSVAEKSRKKHYSHDSIHDLQKEVENANKNKNKNTSMNLNKKTRVKTQPTSE
jgi:hypothetical protein